MDNLQELPQNAISDLTIHGLTIDNQQSPLPLSLLPGHPIPVPVHRRAYDNRPDGLAQIPPLTLPPPAKLHLELTLDEKISDGRVGVVYACTVDPACSAATANYYIPPLVVKIAPQYYARDIAQEAWLYEEMGSLQGVITPRCYGFFVAEVPKSLDIPAWKDYDFDDSDTEDQTENLNSLVSILVLERLGERLPFGKDIPSGAFDDIRQMYDELGERGVIHVDIRWHNILSEPQSPPGLPGRPSTYANRVYRWRIIDFDRSERTCAMLPYIRSVNDDSLEPLFEGLLEGVLPDLPSI